MFGTFEILIIILYSRSFRTVLWEGTVCRILRRAVVQADQKALNGAAPCTPRKPHATQRRDDECGTPSKMIEKHFSSMSIDSSIRQLSHPSEALITQIHNTRTHLSTDHLLEYRLEIAPAQLVRLAEAGIKGTRRPPDKDDVYSEDEGDGEEGKKSKDPNEHMRVWMPADMVKLVEPKLVEQYEEMLRAKGKGNKKKGTKKKNPVEVEMKGPAAKGEKKAAKDKNAPLSEGSMGEDKVRNNFKTHFMVSIPQAKSTFPVSPISKSKSNTISKPTASGSTSTADSQYKTKKKAVAATHADMSDGSMGEDKVQMNLKSHFMVSKLVPFSSTTKSAAKWISSGSNSASVPSTNYQPKVRSKPPAILHIPLYDTSDDESNSTVRASAKIIPIDMFSNEHDSSSSFKNSPPRKELAPFPMDLRDDLELNYGNCSFVVDKDDLFDDVAPKASPPQPSRKNALCSSDSESFETRTNKSPRHSKKQKSPSKNPSNRKDVLLRPGSPSPMRTASKLLLSSTHPPRTTPKPLPRNPIVVTEKKQVLDNGIIDISSEDDVPAPSSKVMEAPLLRARAKTASAFTASAPTKKAKAKSALAAADLNAQIYETDIIDLT